MNDSFILNQFPFFFLNNNLIILKEISHKSQFIYKLFKVGKYMVINRFFKKKNQKQKLLSDLSEFSRTFRR